MGSGGGETCPFGPGTTPAPEPGAGLGDEVEAALRGHLEALAAGWSEASVQGANDILSKPEHSAAGLRAFFDRYFVDEEHALSNDLWNYLGYPTFHWFDAGVHERLQRALMGSLRRRLELELQAEGLGAAMDTDAGLRQTLFNAGRFMVALSKDGVLPEAEVRDSQDFLARLVETHPSWLKNDKAIDPSASPYVPALRAQLLTAFTDLAPSGPCERAQIAEHLGLSGARLEIWSGSGVLLHDNLGFDEAQLGWIRDLLAEVPEEIQDLGHITQHELLGNVPPRQENIFSFRSVNIFDVDIGTIPENQFPSDVAPVSGDLFVTALAHEVNHIVDAHHVEKTPALKARKDALLAKAGTTDLEYLRSMVGGAFFQNAPQEFFASISNQWFTDSAHTLALALARFDAGHRQPLGQALFFAEVYSLGGASTRFYTAHYQGELSVDLVPVSRDGQGRIVSLELGGKKYKFSLDGAGDVSAYTVE